MKKKDKTAVSFGDSYWEGQLAKEILSRLKSTMVHQGRESDRNLLDRAIYQLKKVFSPKKKKKEKKKWIDLAEQRQAL